MTVAYDAISKSGTGLTGATPNPMTWTHTPVGTPRGIIVFCYQESGIGSTITGATYGGVTMERCAFATQLSGGEGGAMDAYFLGDAIPTGAQTVSVDHNGSSGDTRWCVAISVTAAADTELIAADTIIGNTETDPTFTFDTGSRSALRFLAAASGADAAGSIAGISGSTAIESLDTGSRGAYIVRADAAASGSSTVGATASSEDVAVVGLAVAEVDTNTVRHDKYTTGSAFTTTTPNTFSHTPKGSTPDGVLVWVYESDGTDTVTGVTYGGVAMTRVGHNDEPGYSEPGAVTLYHLGLGVPSGTQTVSIAHTGSSTTKQAVCQTLTAPGDTTVIVSGALSNSSVQDAALTLDASTSTGLMVFGGATGDLGRQVSSGEATLRGPSDDVGSKGWAFGRAAVNRTGSQSLELKNRAADEVVMFGAVVGFTDTIPPGGGVDVGDGDTTVEVGGGFGTDPFGDPVYTDISDYIRAMDFGRGRSSVFQSFDAGTCSLTLDNRDGRFDPGNTAGPYYPDVVVGTPIRIRLDRDGDTSIMWVGNIDRIRLEYPGGGHDGIAVFEASENISLLTRRALANDYAAASSGDRVDDVLDEVGWPTSLRAITATLTTVPAVDFSDDTIGDNVSAWTHINNVALAEQGAVYVNKLGELVFEGRTAGPASSSATFGVGGGEYPYQDITFAYDNDLLINRAKVRNVDLGVGWQQADDTTSQGIHGVRMQTYQLDTIANDGEALSMAQWTVLKYATVKQRVTSITINPDAAPDDLWPFVRDVELRDVITVKFATPGAGDDINQVCRVEWLRHTATPGQGNWVLTLGLLPLADVEFEDFFTLDVSELDSTDVLA